jgi:hypothetical protein
MAGWLAVTLIPEHVGVYFGDIAPLFCTLILCAIYISTMTTDSRDTCKLPATSYKLSYTESMYVQQFSPVQTAATTATAATTGLCPAPPLSSPDLTARISYHTSMVLWIPLSRLLPK